MRLRRLSEKRGAAAETKTSRSRVDAPSTAASQAPRSIRKICSAGTKVEYPAADRSHAAGQSLSVALMHGAATDQTNGREARYRVAPGTDGYGAATVAVLEGGRRSSKRLAEPPSPRRCTTCSKGQRSTQEMVSTGGEVAGESSLARCQGHVAPAPPGRSLRRCPAVEVEHIKHGGGCRGRLRGPLATTGTPASLISVVQNPTSST